MNAQLKGSFYYFLINLKRPFVMFWTILLSFILITYGLDILMGHEGSVVYDLSFPIYIFGAVFGFVIVKNGIPYLIKMGSTRINIFIISGISMFVLALINAVIASTINLIFEPKANEGFLTITTDDNSYTFSHLADLVANNTWYSRIVIDTSIGFFLLAVFFVLALIFYRYGYIGGFGTLAIIMTTVVFGIAQEWLIDFFSFIFRNFDFTFFYQLLLTGIVVYLLSYVFMQRLTI